MSHIRRDLHRATLETGTVSDAPDPVEETVPLPWDARVKEHRRETPQPETKEASFRHGADEVFSVRHASVFHGPGRKKSDRLVVGPDLPVVAVEQYRRLAATLHHAQLERTTRVVMVTSAVPAEGKSLTASNLALMLSQSYARTVCLVDADLRRPSLHELFNVPNVSGLNDCLSSESTKQLSVHQLLPTLFLLPAGRPNPDPTPLLTSQRMRVLLEQAAGSFDWVVVDTPPACLLPDASLLARMVDVAILVVGADRTPYELAQRAVEAIGRERILGVLLNRVEAASLPGGYYYSRYYG